MKQFPQNKPVPRLWGATDSDPATATEWRANFAAWLRALDWFLKHSNGIEGKRARKSAPSTSLLHAPEPDSVSSGARAALWRLRGDLSSEPETARALDFGDASTLILWLDFLNEHPKRRGAWQRFQRARGALEVL